MFFGSRQLMVARMNRQAGASKLKKTKARDSNELRSSAMVYVMSTEEKPDTTAPCSCARGTAEHAAFEVFFL